jgi:hypothetical protein
MRLFEVTHVEDEVIDAARSLSAGHEALLWKGV